MIAAVYLPIWVIPLAAWLACLAATAGVDFVRWLRRRRALDKLWADDGDPKRLRPTCGAGRTFDASQAGRRVAVSAASFAGGRRPILTGADLPPARVYDQELA